MSTRSTVSRTKPSKIVYVLGPAYSGSTLFGLALGSHPSIINLGEVANLQNDYSPGAICTCGEKLESCAFWKPMAHRLNSPGSHPNFTLERGTGHETLDQRGGRWKARFLLGSEPSSLFSESYLDHYMSKNAVLFNTALNLDSRVEFAVDLSKSAERLRVLRESDDLEMWAVYLDRDPLMVFASTMKRPKRTRSKFRFKALREALWLRLRNRAARKAFYGIPAERRFEMNFEAFTASPRAELDRALRWLGLPEHGSEVPVKEGLALDIAKQHVYVGNRWLFNRFNSIVRIAARDDVMSLTAWQRLAFWLVGPSRKRRS